MLKKVINFFEPAFTVLSLLQFSSAVLPLIISGGISEGDGKSMSSFDYSLNQAVYLLVYFITFFLLILRWKKVVYVISKERWILGLVGIAVLSFIWSVEPITTLKQVLDLIGATAFGIYLATRYTLKEQINLLCWMSIVAIALSILFAIALPKYGIMASVHEGAVRGIYTHKNTFGRILVLGATVFLIHIFSHKNNRLIFTFFLGIAVILLVLTRSTGALGNFLIMTTLLLIYPILRWRVQVMIPALVALITASSGLLWWFLSNADTLLEAVGKDPSLTGRTYFWSYLWETIEKRFWLGYGFDSFWNGLDGPSAYIWRAARWKVPDAHNGFLELWLNLGFVGVSVFAVGYVLNLLKAIATIRKYKTPVGMLPLLYLTFMVLVNLAESSLLGGIFWVLYAAIAFSFSLPIHQPDNQSLPNLNDRFKSLQRPYSSSI
jgi:exopolysaccharide production protein ExoQ